MSWAFSGGGGGGVVVVVWSILTVVWNMASWNWSIVVVFSCLYLFGVGLLNCLDLVYSARVLVSSWSIMFAAGCNPNLSGFGGCCGA